VTSKIVELCIDAKDPIGMAHFWTEALNWENKVDDDGDVILIPSDRTPFIILFEPNPDNKQEQNRIHLDLTTTSQHDQDEIVASLLERGGKHIDIGQSADEPHIVLADVEGNELCIIEPNNNFLSNTGPGRIGAINCTGRKETGYFWSQVLDWPLVWDQDGETAIQSPEGGPKITWSGAPLIPKHAKNRLHLDIAAIDGDQHAEANRLISLGARRVDIGQGDVSWIVMADPDDNEFCLLSSG
jgi:hypothetical protein